MYGMLHTVLMLHSGSLHIRKPEDVPLLAVAKPKTILRTEKPPSARFKKPPSAEFPPKAGPGYLWAACELLHPSLSSPSLSILPKVGSNPKLGAQKGHALTAVSKAASYQELWGSLLTHGGSAISPPSCWKPLPEGITDLKSHY